jgi:hypothetical protein
MTVSTSTEPSSSGADVVVVRQGLGESDSEFRSRLEEASRSAAPGAVVFELARSRRGLMRPRVVRSAEGQLYLQPGS